VTDGGTVMGRHAGLLVPLFSCPSTRSWGIGEFSDLPVVATWMRDAGLGMLQLLPLNEMAPGQRSPYSATSAMALDPIFISVPAVPDFQAAGGESVLDDVSRRVLASARTATKVDYRRVRVIKIIALRAAFERFFASEWTRDSARAADLRRFIEEQGWWLEDYALFRALLHEAGGREWQSWPEGVRDRRPESLAGARQQHHQEILFRQYLQWIAHGQWKDARSAAHGIRVFGDLPFGVAADSADVWANQDLFSFDATIGAPPDAFSDDGQNWRLPMYRWAVIAAREYEWFTGRARRIAELFDGYRIDHVVGLFRTWVFPIDGRPAGFVPADPGDQLNQGQAVLRALIIAGAEIVAEDLGTIPDFVRATLRSLNIPGYRVLRWEREWDTPGMPFRNPSDYPARSLATSGTHDTETLAAWWNLAAAAERTAALVAIGATPAESDSASGSAARGSVHAARGATPAGPSGPFGPAVRELLSDPSAAVGPVVRDLLLEALYASGSDLLVLPIQDVFGWTDRINVPGVIDDLNWTWKLPWAVDHLAAQPAAVERATTLRAWGASYGRLGN